MTALENKVLLLGIDGLSPILLEKMIEEGKLPFFKTLKEKELFGTLQTTIPPLSAPAWTSIFTGLNPGNHGVFGWITESFNQGKRKVQIQDSKSFKGKAIWDILGKKEKKSIIINVPLTYPPPMVHGLLISGFPAPTNQLSTHSKKKENILRKMFPRYKMDADIQNINYNLLDKDELIASSENSLKARQNLVKYLIQDEEWDLFGVVYTVLDRIQHVFWPYIDEKYPKKIQDIEQYKEVVPTFYQKIEKNIEEIIELAPKGTHVMIVSDHGFESMYKSFDLKKWLTIQGYMTPEKKNTGKYSILKPIYKTITRLNIVDVSALTEKLPQTIKKRLISSDLCWMGTGGFYLKNLKGAQKTEITREIMDKLKEVTDPETGHKVISSVYAKEDIYHGPYLNRSLDVIVLPEPGYDLSAENKTELIEFNQWPIGNHVSENVRKGTFIALGDRFSKGSVCVSGESIVPIILELLDIHHNRVLDGKIPDSVMNIN